MSTPPRSSSRDFSGGKKSLPALIAGALLALVAGYFGLDLGNTNNTSSSAPPTSASSVRPTPTSAFPTAGFTTCSMDTLPAEADDTRDSILAGGPFEYPENDNRRFGNYENTLPNKGRGYYREYTVDTPGLHHRGERRIITGGGTETDPQVWYYTDDHYESFCAIPDAEQ
ncbi:MAG: ribonuclease domain-containing protein [Corynebacterium sp.]|nr:ribonuclease domain-containing protein [Corynebacterium sp.]